MVDLFIGRTLRGWGRLVACIAGIGVAMGSVFVALGALEETLGLAGHEVMELFATGFACGAVAALVALLSSVDNASRESARSAPVQPLRRFK